MGWLDNAEIFQYKVPGHLYPEIRLVVSNDVVFDDTGWDGFVEYEMTAIASFRTHDEAVAAALAWVDDVENNTVTPVRWAGRLCVLDQMSGRYRLRSLVNCSMEFAGVPLPARAVEFTLTNAKTGRGYYAIEAAWLAHVVEMAIGLLAKEKGSFRRLKDLLK